MKNQQEKQSYNPVISSLLAEYKKHLYCEERSANTISKYTRDLQAFFVFLAGQKISKEKVLDWKEQLTSTHAPTSVNSMLAAVNNFLEWIQLPQCKVKPLKIQREIFARPERELSQKEYFRLIQTAHKQQNHRLALLLQTIGSTGIRVSELCYITVEAMETRRAVVDSKGKSRTIFLPTDLCHALHRYCRESKINSGIIFRTKNGRPLDRSNIWHDMKALCKSADIESSKVFPHNLRHLFARVFYGMEKDLSRLADLLGHSNITTTRIYTKESGYEHTKQLDRMHLVVV